jgi:diaminopimelate decarboxylase
VELVGLHFHRGGTIRTPTDLDHHLHQVLAYCDHLHEVTGWYPEILDVGGSLACPTVAALPARQYRLNRAFGSDLLPPDPAGCVTLGQAAELIAGAVTDHAERRGVPRPVVFQEPGRAMTGDTQFLLTTVLDVKDDVSPTHAVLDAGINVAEPVLSEYHHLLSVTAAASSPSRSYRLAGPICTPADVLYYNWRLPKLSPGDVLAIMDSGAYFIPFSTSFSFPRPAVVLVDGAGARLARRAETFDDLVDLDVAWQLTAADTTERAGHGTGY